MRRRFCSGWRCPAVIGMKPVRPAITLARNGGGQRRRAGPPAPDGDAGRLPAARRPAGGSAASHRARQPDLGRGSAIPARRGPDPVARVHCDQHSRQHHAPAHRHQERGTWRACCMTDLPSLAPLFEPRHGEIRRAGPRSRPRPLTRPAGGSGASPSDLTNATAQPQRRQKQ
jgi:hypothetical protein